MDTLPPFGRTALLLDLDGTLLDLAPTPDAVTVAAGLTDALAALRDAMGGALAIVTGRPIETVDRLLGDVPGAVAGEHGGAVRHRPGGPVERPDLPPPPDSWIRAADALASAFPGAMLERKARGFALHFRQAPQAGPLFRSVLQALVDERPAFQLLPAHMLWEVRPVGADKGKAVSLLMERAPFQGRLPLFIGDDVTDEDGMQVARQLGGAGLRVDAAFGDPAGVRGWLARSAAAGDWAALPRGRPGESRPGERPRESRPGEPQPARRHQGKPHDAS
ncbi:trehalose-phosphatase [Rhodopila sp.]|jgi:trehalose 6-phosphate phosphatase|uniref:trehalose-phosphatase n=1 Tax=Rhodopila sp. TaxID=2480087 RepID=UPI002B9E5088|nr:trehalose-phosphatase [Rhodopila sp.]HVZ10603.1 trehalose-phosphatase [Rhodopila sp.]